MNKAKENKSVYYISRECEKVCVPSILVKDFGKKFKDIKFHFSKLSCFV